jgi:uncharacterized protein YgiM (DUF1202 family)
MPNKVVCCLFSLVVMCLVALALPTTPALAQQVNDIAKVNSSDGELNMRMGPSTKDPILHVLKNGDSVRVLRISGNWARVRHATKGEGWVYMPLLSVPDNPADARFKPADRAFVCNPKSDVTNVRNGPGAQDFRVIDSLKNGVRVAVDRVVTNKDGYIYYEVSYVPAGQTRKRTGYIYHNALRDRCNGVSVANQTAKPSKTVPKPSKTTSKSSKTTSKPAIPDSGLALKGGKCMITVASRQTPGEVLSFFKAMDGWSKSFRSGRQAVLMRNRWFAITIGIIDKREFDARVKSDLIRNVRGMPGDIYCSNLTQAVRIFNQESLEKEHAASLSGPKNVRGDPLPPLKPEHRFELHAKGEERAKQAYYEFASLWNATRKEDLDKGDYILRTTAVYRAHKNPRGLEWCQFRIDVRTDTVVNGYTSQSTTSSYFGNAVELGLGIVGLDEESRKRHREMVFYRKPDWILDTLQVKDGRTQARDGYTIAGCKGAGTVGFKSVFNGARCEEPRFTSDNDDMIQKRFEAMGTYYIQCAIEVAIAKEMSEEGKVGAVEAEAQLIKDNPVATEALRAAFKSRSDETLRIKDAGLSNISGLVRLSNVKNLHLEGNQITDISVLGRFKDLSFLNLSGNRIVAVDALEGLTGLVSLNLSNNAITDVSALAKLTGLKGLNLRGNPIADLAPIQHLIDDPGIRVLLD